MVAFLIRRTFGMIIVLIAVSFVTYLIFFKIPGGDVAVRIAGRQATPQNIADIRLKLGLDKNIFVQWWSMMKQLLSGSLISYYDGTNVVQQIKEGMPETFSLCIGAGVIWLVFGMLVGTISAVTAGGTSDRAITELALIGISLPVAWLGLLLRYFFAEGGRGVSWFPDGGYVPLDPNPWQWFYHLLLPWFTLAILFIGFYGRVLRSNILDTINEDFVRTAKAKGLSSRRILVKHTLRASLIPIVTLFGLDFAAVLGGGAIITETVYTSTGSASTRPSRSTTGPAAAHGRDALRRGVHRRLLDARRRRLRVSGPADPADLMAETLLEVNDLNVQFATEDGIVRAVDGISFELERGKVLGIVGESGSGKSVTAMTIMGLTRGVNARFDGEVLYKGTDLLEISDNGMQNYRGNELGMIFQDPMTSLNPVYRIGEQIVEAIQAHESVDKRSAHGAHGRAAARRSASRTRSRASTTTRTSSRAACGSGR